MAADEQAKATDDAKEQPDDREPSAVRQAELRAAYEANVAAGNAPYAGVWIHTRGELKWVLRERDWSGYPFTIKAHPNLRSVVLSLTNLSGTNLYEADLRSADLSLANLSGADLAQANLSSAHLFRANLSGANLTQANLSGTSLREANLSGTSLREANLSGAFLREARMDAATVLVQVQLDTGTELADVVWNEVPLTRVDWSRAPRLGDEDWIAAEINRGLRLRAIRDAARAYRGLGVALRGQGLVDYAAGYRLREQRLERRALRLERRYGGWFFSLLLDAVAGYGERPGRIFGAYVLVIASFAVAYGLVTHLVETQLHQLSWDEALVLSLTSFHGRGFFPGSLPLGDWVARIAAGEAVIGLFIELILIATFSKRFLGN